MSNREPTRTARYLDWREQRERPVRDAYQAAVQSLLGDVFARVERHLTAGGAAPAGGRMDAYDDGEPYCETCGDEGEVAIATKDAGDTDVAGYEACPDCGGIP